MPRYSSTSQERLATCHPDLREIFAEVIQHFDNTIIEGHRSRERQNRLQREGKSQVRWPNSKHNSYPSMAVDAIPYPIDWNDRERMTLFAGYVIGVADQLFDLGRINHRVRWGGDWSMDTEVKDNRFDDLVHFEIVKP